MPQFGDLINELISSNANKNDIDVYFCSEQKDTLVRMLNIVIEMADKSLLPESLKNNSTAVESYEFTEIAHTKFEKVKPVSEIVRSPKPRVRIMKGDLTDQKVDAIVNTVGEDNSIKGPLF
jgi:hypothetical protein